MPEYFSYIAIVVAILLIATILVICYPNLRYRSKVKRLYKNLRKIKWESWEYSLDNLNAFRKFDPKKVMQKQAFTHGFSEFLRKTARMQNVLQKASTRSTATKGTPLKLCALNNRRKQYAHNHSCI